MILYIAKREAHNLGANTHLRALKDIYGKNNVFEIDLLKEEYIEKNNYISFGYDGKKIIKRIIRYAQGNINFITDSIIDSICEIIEKNNISLVFSEESDLGKFYRVIKVKYPGIKIVCFFHDISYDLFRGRIKNTPKWKIHYILECYRVISQEKEAIKYIDRIVVFHEKDAVKFFNIYGIKRINLIPLCMEPNMVSSTNKNIITHKNDEKTILFVCSSYYVNIKGFLWFYRKIINNLEGKFHVDIVGSGTEQFKNVIHTRKVRLIGRVDKLEKYYENADIVIAPVFEGGGMKMKTIEALAFGKCLVSTSESLNGYWEVIPEDMKNRLIYKCDTEQQWIKACNNLLANDINKLNEEIIVMANKYFSYDYLTKKMRKLLKDV